MAGVKGDLERKNRDRTTGPGEDAMGLEGAKISVEVFVRSLAPPGGVHDEQLAILERLEVFEDAGPVDDWSVTIWGDRLCECEVCTSTTAGRLASERVREFRNWSERADESVSLPFEHREVTADVTGTDFEAMVPPRLTIAIYDEDQLLRVYPCTADGTHYTVTDGLDWLELAGRPVPRPPAE